MSNNKLVKNETENDGKSVLDFLLEISSFPKGHKIFANDNFKLVRNLCNQRDGFYSIEEKLKFIELLTNLAGEGSNFCDEILCEDFNLVPNFFNLLENAESPLAISTARLFVNLSRHSPSQFYRDIQKIEQTKEKHENFIFHKLTECAAPNNQDAWDFAVYLAYILTNLSVIKDMRNLLVADQMCFLKILKMFTFPQREIAHCAVNIIYNISFDDESHEKILTLGDDVGEKDALIVALLTLIADKDDQLDEEEIAKLPIPLQYYDKKRSEDLRLRLRLLQTLYQLCSSTFGRQMLRERGIYPLLRELDRATICKDEKTPEEWRLTLHAIIGVLIRREEEMGIPEGFEHSIRNLGLKQLEDKPIDTHTQ